LERYLPLLDDIVAVRLLAKVLGNFTREDGNWQDQLGVLVDIVMESPLEVAWILPKFNGVCHKLHSAYISTTSGPKVVLESPK